ncbi:hypothetical protein, partial [Klebsiella grimontii]
IFGPRNRKLRVSFRPQPEPTPITIMGLKPGPKRIADSTGEPDKRQRDNKKTPGNTDKLKPSKSSKK